MLSLFNHYSAPVIGLLLGIGLAAVFCRRNAKTRDWLFLAALMVGCGGTWFVLRPVARPAVALAGRPLLLEVQSPYCLGCLAVKPSVDRLETELGERLVVQRVNIQGAAGRQLAGQYAVERTPTFILFDARGEELWRGSGRLDARAVRSRVPGL